ncbi:MFS transporter [Curtobacterium sp. VKM Ac-2865]|uniref:MFS transporter n=1 Tax=Curtobacterium sp. VKM Ac-2865 TaxID=2783817 RepID=UPI00188BEBCE|nr:MFS transporter [Curtobacterium sp. VKM Ac-2865]MBF4581770.1 MFS transporter [Curtobacterium sp. VKM Ac-2865]
MKRSFSNGMHPTALVVVGTALIAVTYGLVRLAYGLVLPDVQADLGLSASTAGGIASGASLLYCVGAVVGFVQAARHPRALVVAATLTAAVGSVGMALAPDAGVFGAAAVLGSAGAGLASPALVQVVMRNVAQAGVSRAQTIVNSGTGPGLVAAGLVALVVLPDWRAAWLVAAGSAVLAGAAVLLLDANADTDTHDTDTDTDTTEHDTDTTPHRPTRPWFRRHTTPLVAAGLLGAGSAAVWNAGRAALVAAGADRTTSIVAWIAIGVGGAAVVLTARWLADLGHRRAWAVTVTAVAIGTLALGLAPGQVVVALVACAVFGWGYTAATGALLTWTAAIDAERAPAGASMLFVVLVLGQAVGGAVAGSAVDAVGYGATLMGAAVVTALAVVATTHRTGGSVPARTEPPVRHGAGW